MTNYKFSQLRALGAAPAPGDLIAILRVSDTSTPPADGSGSNQTVTVAELLSAGAVLVAATAPAVVALTFASTIAINAALGNVFSVTLTASTGTLGTPSSPVDGQPIRVRVIQDGTGGRTLAYGSGWDFGAAGAPTLSTAPGACDYIVGEWNAAKSKVCVSAALGY